MAVNQNAVPLTCDKTLLTIYPCLQCLSEQELLTGLAVAWGSAAGMDLTDMANLNTALEGSACLECLSDSQLLQAELAILINYFGSNTSPVHTSSTSALSRQAQHRLRALIVYFMCQYFVPVT